MENMTMPAVTTTSVGLRYGLLTGIAWIIIDLILRTTGLSFKYSIYLPASLIVYIVGIIIAHRYFKQQHGGFMTYGQGVLIVVVLSLVSGLLAGIFGYAYVNFIDPEYAMRMRNDMEAWLSTFPNVQEEQIDKAVADMSDEKIKAPTQIIRGLFASAIGGLLMGLIISIFTKNNRPEFE